MAPPLRLPRLRDFNFFTRVGITGILFALTVGQAAALTHLRSHYDNRDERKGFTLDDIRAAYRGINAPSPIAVALSVTPPHPGNLKPADRDVLQKWIASGKIDENYDNPDLGPASPKEIIAASCATCHSARAADEKARVTPMDTLGDIKKLAFPRVVNPTPIAGVAASAHAHAPALASMSFVVFALAVMTRWWRWLTGLIIGVSGLGLALDLAAWWIARDHEAWIAAIPLGGAMSQLGLALLIIMTFFDLWIPGGRSPEH